MQPPALRYVVAGATLAMSLLTSATAAADPVSTDRSVVLTSQRVDALRLVPLSAAEPNVISRFVRRDDGVEMTRVEIPPVEAPRLRLFREDERRPPVRDEVDYLPPPRPGEVVAIAEPASILVAGVGLALGVRRRPGRRSKTSAK